MKYVYIYYKHRLNSLKFKMKSSKISHQGESKIGKKGFHMKAGGRSRTPKREEKGVFFSESQRKTKKRNGGFMDRDLNTFEMLSGDKSGYYHYQSRYPSMYIYIYIYLYINIYIYIYRFNERKSQIRALG